MGAATSLATLGLSYALGQGKQKRENQAIAADAKARAADIRAQEAAANRRDEQALRERLAAQRARAGAGGTATGGSGAAVLRGLTEETRAAQVGRSREADRQIAQLGQKAQTRQRSNLLDFGSDTLIRGVGTVGRSGAFSLLE